MGTLVARNDLTDELESTREPLSRVVPDESCRPCIVEEHGSEMPTGGTIVLVLSAFFVLAWLFAPSHGVLARARPRSLRLAGVDRREDPGVTPVGDIPIARLQA